MEKHSEIKKAITRIIRNKKRFPSLQEMCSSLHYTEGQTRKYMEVLADEGFLERYKNWYRFPEKVKVKLEPAKNAFQKQHAETMDETDKGEKTIKFAYTDKGEIVEDEFKIPIKKIKSDKGTIEVTENNPLPPLSETNKKVKSKIKPRFWIPKKLFKPKTKKSKEKYSAPIYIIQILMGIIGIGASIISIYYTTVWLLEFLPWGFALLLSSIMVGFAVSAFETVILFLSGQVTRSRVAQWSITIGFAILWASVTFFSIFSTIAGQYNKFVANLQEESKQGIDTSKMVWNSLQEHKMDLRERLKEYRENVKTYTEISKTMTGLENRTENNKTWAENQYRLRKANEEVRLILDQLNSIRIKETQLLEESNKNGVLLGVTEDSEDIVNFYGWLSKIIGIDKNKTQFFMSLAPATFCDLMAPIGLALFLFLRSKYK